MRALQRPSATVAGIVAFYSIIHIPRADVPQVLREFARVLATGGRLLLSVHGGTGIVHRDDFLDHPVPFEATLFSLGEIVTLVEGAGFRVDEARQRDPSHAAPLCARPVNPLSLPGAATAASPHNLARTVPITAA